MMLAEQREQIGFSPHLTFGGCTKRTDRLRCSNKEVNHEEFKGDDMGGIRRLHNDLGCELRPFRLVE
jgi:hypothetical protein